PFPEGPIFTGWFDTGRQGKEWPGDFEIVPHKPPLTWKAARSVLDPKSGRPWLRLGLRGERPLNETTRLRFRYRLTGASAMTVCLGGQELRLSDLKKSEWAEKTVEFSVGKGRRASEVRFVLPEGAELMLDDVLLY